MSQTFLPFGNERMHGASCIGTLQGNFLLCKFYMHDMIRQEAPCILMLVLLYCALHCGNNAVT